MNMMAERNSTGLARLLRPRSIAVFGGHAASVLLRQSDKIGYSGEIWPVHPRHELVEGRPAFRSTASLPGVPDAAFIGVNRHAGIDLVADLAARGCGGAVAYASGYAEAGAEAGAEGRQLQDALVQAAGPMPLFGPNCYGFINYLDKTLIWPDQFGGGAVARGVAIITQSGNIGLNITMQRRALPIGYLITLGNQAIIGHAATMHAVLDDPRVTAIGLHMESLGDPAAFAHAVARAHAQGVAVVALKTGRSAAGAQIALSHTASLASADTVVDAFFKRIGVARVDSVPVLLETLKIMHVHGGVLGRSLASLSCSGGEAALMADCAIASGLHFAPLNAESHAGIAATLPDLVSISNPLDYHTFGWRNRAALAATFAATMQAGADLNILILDFPRLDQCDAADWAIAAAAMADAAQQTGKRAAVLATLPEAFPESYAETLVAQGMLPLFGMNEAIAAIFAAASVEPACGYLPAFAGPGPGASAKTIAEFAGKQMLAAYGVAVPEGAVATTETAAIETATRIGFPVVVKAAGAELAHKTEMGAVRLNLSDATAVQAAARALLPITGAVLVEKMLHGAAAELIIGVARDPVLGFYLLLGSGGILAELVGDTATLLMPASRTEIAAALDGLRVSRMLHGLRGSPAGDTAAALDAIENIQSFALAHATRLAELDVNPLIVRAEGHGAFAADVLMRLAPEPVV